MAEFFDILISRHTPLSTSEKCLLRDVTGDTDTLMSLSLPDISRIIGRSLRKTTWSVKKAAEEAEKAGEALADGQINCLFFQQSGYPPQLAEIWDPPYLLYCRGELPDWSRPSVAVVGTRLATGAGADSAFELGLDFGRRNIRVVSGLALGIDSAAHAGNTAAGEGSVAVLGSGVDRIYPASNRQLARRMLDAGGMIVSEYPPGADVRRFNFPQRNRIISGLSRAVVVVEAPGKSGALITADFALEQGRDLFIHSAALRVPGSRKRIERMLFDGAPLVSRAEEVLAGWPYENRPSGEEDLSGMDAAKEPGEILADDLRNELKGYYIKFNGNYFRRTHYESSYFTDS